MIRIIVYPIGGGRFRGFRENTGEELVRSSRQPFLDAARTLLAAGVDPATKLVMRHRDTDYDTLTATVGTAAKLTVDERSSKTVFRPYRERPAFDAGAAADASEATEATHVSPDPK